MGLNKRDAWTRVYLSAIIVLVTACASTPPPTDLDPATSALQFQERHLDDAALLAQADGTPPCAPHCSWDLDRLTLVAWSNDPGLTEARAALARVMAEVDQANQRPNPALNLGSEYNRDGGSGTSPWLWSAALEFTFETAGKRQIRVEGAKAGVEEQLWAYALQVCAVRQRLREARLDLARREQEATFAARIATVQKERRELLLRRVDIGALARPEIYQAEREAANAVAEQLRADAELRQARIALASALSVPVTALDGVTLPPLPAFESNAPAFSPQYLRESGVENRADLARTLAAYRRADAALRLEVAKRTPDIAIGPGLIFDQGDHKFSLSTNLIAPLLDQNQHSVAIAIAARDEAAAHFVKLQTEAFGEIEAARSRLIAALDTYRDWGTRRERDEESMRQTHSRFKAGAIDRLELLDQELLVLQAEQLRVDAAAEVYAAFAQVESAVQRPVWPESRLIPPSGSAGEPERNTR